MSEEDNLDKKAVAHAHYVANVVYNIYIEAFKHGYKHGVTDKE